MIVDRGPDLIRVLFFAVFELIAASLSTSIRTAAARVCELAYLHLGAIRVCDMS